MVVLQPIFLKVDVVDEVALFDVDIIVPAVDKVAKWKSLARISGLQSQAIQHEHVDQGEAEAEGQEKLESAEGLVVIIASGFVEDCSS
jgi:hypothetical protein